MQQLQDFQLKHRSKFNQLILLDEQACIVSSCDSIFNPPQHTSVISWFPFMESIYSNVWESLSKESNINFNKIETPIPELPGIYDFTFSKVTIDQKELILWVIYDYTDLYENLKQFQQRKNELEIHRETLERRHKSVKKIEEIKLQQNIIIESLDHIQLTYFNNIKSALLAPVNALDGITFLLAGALKQKDQKYTQQLRLVLKQLTLILDELEDGVGNSSSNFSQQHFNLAALCADINHSLLPKNKALDINFHIDSEIPDVIIGHDLYLRQILYGVLSNAVDLHPGSSFKINITPLQQHKNNLELQFQVIESLGSKTAFLSKEDYNHMTYQLSIIKQIIDIQKGTIYVNKNPKELSVSISFNLTYSIH